MKSYYHNAVVSIVVMQGLYLACYNLAKQNDLGRVFMYLLVFVPLGLGLFMMGRWSEGFRRQILYSHDPNAQTVPSGDSP